MSDPLTRFSNRVADYTRYRPGYPDAILDRLAVRLPEHPTVIDVGAGTGIFADLMLQRGWTVHAVEPNAPMREACAQRLGGQSDLSIHDGTAEATGLPDSCADLVVAAQAFHWFDSYSALREFERLLRPDGFVALIWNNRQTASTAFLVDYENLLQEFATDYRKVNHQRFGDGRLESMLADGFELIISPNIQSFDFEGLRGRLLSSSYAPAEGHVAHAPMLRRLREIFDQHARDSLVELLYTTELYIGRPVAGAGLG
ncbi:MAG: class I SAM-dependent methyltransferase [Planctomycetota bacterium]